MATISKLTIPVLVGDEIVMQTFNLPSGGSGASSPEAIGIGYAVCSTAYITTAKTASLEGYNLETNGIVSVKFVNAVNANATLNINSEGAKPIYYRGNPIINGIIKGGDIATFMYDGTNYQIISLDNPWRAEVQITGDPDAIVTVTNDNYSISDTVTLDANGFGVYICKAPGTYVFSVAEE